MPASATSSKSSLLSDICGYRAHGALLQVVPLELNRTPVGAGPLYRTEWSSTGTCYVLETPRVPRAQSPRCSLIFVAIAPMGRSYRWYRYS